MASQLKITYLQKGLTVLSSSIDQKLVKLVDLLVIFPSLPDVATKGAGVSKHRHTHTNTHTHTHTPLYIHISFWNICHDFQRSYHVLHL